MDGDSVEHSRDFVSDWKSTRNNASTKYIIICSLPGKTNPTKIPENAAWLGGRYAWRTFLASLVTCFLFAAGRLTPSTAFFILIQLNIYKFKTKHTVDDALMAKVSRNRWQMCHVSQVSRPDDTCHKCHLLMTRVTSVTSWWTVSHFYVAGVTCYALMAQAGFSKPSSHFEYEFQNLYFEYKCLYLYFEYKRNLEFTFKNLWLFPVFNFFEWHTQVIYRHCNIYHNTSKIISTLNKIIWKCMSKDQVWKFISFPILTDQKTFFQTFSDCVGTLHKWHGLDWNNSRQLPRQWTSVDQEMMETRCC